MLKKVLILLLLFILQPASSNELKGEIESAQKSLVYLYTNNCGYCVKFNPLYNKLEKNYNSKYKFYKIDANSEYGQRTMQKLNAYYVPYVVLMDNNKQTLNRISPQCLLNYSCIKDAVDKFLYL